MDPVSPELALVDPDLAERLRRLLPESGDCLSPRPRIVPAPAPPPASRLPHPRPSATVVAAALVIALFVGSPALDLIPRDTSAGPTLVPDEGAERTPTIVEPAPSPKPKPAQAVRAGTRLQWPKAARADFYNLVLWRGGTRVIDLWPRRNNIVIPAGGKLAGRDLAAGRYLWFAYAGFEEKNGTRYSRLLARGELRITR